MRSPTSTRAGWAWRCWIDTENCLNFLGLRCDVCYRVCPVIDKAITLEKVSQPAQRPARHVPAHRACEACTGCGKCEKSCVLEKAAIKVLPATMARGEAARHYRWAGRTGKPPLAALVRPAGAEPACGAGAW